MLALVLLSSLAVVAQQPCAFPALKPVPLQQVQQCVSQLTVNPAAKKLTLTSLSDAMQLYAFRDIVVAPPESALFHIAVDVPQRLQTLAETPLVSDWAFHQAINQIYIDLKHVACV
jgi:hypothetical protein